MNNQALQTIDSQTIVPADVSAAALQSALAGDLSQLPGPERLKFYGAVCSTCGLNPVTKPFDWITFQGKMTLYANKGCAEQLRQLHKVSVEIIERKVEFGCLIVRVKARTPDGRHDEAMAAVPFNEKAPADAALAMMKCETKAKRRVTFSLCGLSLFVDREIEEPEPQTSTVISAADSVDDKIAKLNAGLTAGAKLQAIDTEVLPQKPEAPTTPPTPAPPVAEAAPIAAAPAPTPQAAQTNGGGAPVSATAAPGLPDDVVRQIEAIFAMGKPNPQACVDYVIAQNKLANGADIRFMDAKFAGKIIERQQQFLAAVEGWAKALAK